MKGTLLLLLICLVASSAFVVPNIYYYRSSSRDLTSAAKITILQVASVNKPSSTTPVNDNNDDDEEEEEENSKPRAVRPLHQNWWPVITVNSLDPTRPNPIELLSIKLVLFQDENGEWNCFEDRCSHRFAPLTEGRVVTDETTGKKCLQCAYHGWEFGSDGSCQKVPQATSVDNVKGVLSYPVRVDIGLVFVWADPRTKSLGEAIELPILPLLREWVDFIGDTACFMRDLPYGYELLGENLLDLSHLPFSHHGFGGLNREMGCPLPFKMLSASQRSKDNPFYEAYLEDAANTDPSFLSRKNPANSTTHVGFYEPCHIRYTRRTYPGKDVYIAAYICPLSPGKSRVLLFNVFEMLLSDFKESSSTANSLKLLLKPNQLKMKLIYKLFTSRFKSPSGHMMSHTIFDGDGIFLHKQGDRMQREDLSYLDYQTPAKADVLVNAFRRYLQATSKVTISSFGKLKIVDAALSINGYNDSIPRSTMLDRYESHTKHCKTCSMALEKQKKRRGFLDKTQTALTGAFGASTAAVIGLATLAVASDIAIPAAAIRVATIIAASTLGASFGTSKVKNGINEDIKSYTFLDYVHAEKD